MASRRVCCPAVCSDPTEAPLRGWQHQRKRPRKGPFACLERVKGIEPSYEAWEAAVLPLNYTREALNHTRAAAPARALRALNNKAGCHFPSGQRREGQCAGPRANHSVHPCVGKRLMGVWRPTKFIAFAAVTSGWAPACVTGGCLRTGAPPQPSTAGPGSVYPPASPAGPPFSEVPSWARAASLRCLPDHHCSW